MLEKIMPREGRFFDLFEQISALIVEGAIEFREMLNQLPQAEKHSQNIKDIEHKADEITHKTVEMLHKTFITPLDRDDIHKLITGLDDILDYIEACSQRMFLYGVTKVTPEAFQLADVCVRSAECIQKAVSGLKNLKHPEGVIKDCVEINRLENEADYLLRIAIAKLFKEEPDVRQVIMLKEVYDFLETATDRCEDVANTIEGIVLEYA